MKKNKKRFKLIKLVVKILLALASFIESIANLLDSLNQ